MEQFTPAAVGGYVPPQPGYESAPVAGMTNQFGQMGFGGQAQPQVVTPQVQVCAFILSQMGRWAWKLLSEKNLYSPQFETLFSCSY